MSMVRRLCALLPLCTAPAMLIEQAGANDDAVQSIKEAAPIEDSAAKERYEQLMQAEGSGSSCMISNSFKDKMLETLTDFGKAVRFIDLDPHEPIKVQLPERYYHPLGRTITFDQFELAIDRDNPSKPYISMTRTPEGVKLEPKVAIQLKDGKLLCVRSLSATVSYESHK